MPTLAPVIRKVWEGMVGGFLSYRHENWQRILCPDSDHVARLQDEVGAGTVLKNRSYNVFAK
jgi:hypothetical protein